MADGLAHCYRCEQVFNARDNLFEDPTNPSSPEDPAPEPSSQQSDAEPENSSDETPEAHQSEQVESAIQEIQKELDPSLAQEPEPKIADHSEIPPLSIDELLATPTKKHSAIATLFWLLTCITLIAAATLQLAWFERTEVIKHPEGRMLLEELCRYAPCKVPQRRDLNLIAVTHRQIISHPYKLDALLVQLTIQNKAPFAQPYPILELSLSTLDEQLVARRSFSPNEYQKPGKGHNLLMPAGIFQEIEMEIEDPGTDVTGFEFNFF